MEAPRSMINVVESKMVELGRMPSGTTSITIKLETMEPEIMED